MQSALKGHREFDADEKYKKGLERSGKWYDDTDDMPNLMDRTWMKHRHNMDET